MNIFLIFFGAIDIVLFGLVIGIVGFTVYGFIDWIAVIPFIVVGIIHEIYLYYSEIKRSFKSSEKSSSEI